MRKVVIIQSVFLIALMAMVGETNAQSIEFTYKYGKRVAKTIGLQRDKSIQGDTTITDRCEYSYSIDEIADLSYEWQVIGGEIISGQNTSEIEVRWDFSGSVVVTESDGDSLGCTVNYRLPVSVDVESFSVEFSADDVLDFSPMTVTFTNETVGDGFEYLWLFGDGDSSTIADPVHEYSSPGLYSVSLEASKGCDTVLLEKIDYIEVIELTDSTNSPTALDETFTLEELSPAGTLVGTVSAEDPNGDELTFAIISGNELEAFQIDENAGDITVADSIPLVFETNPIFELSVEVRDSLLADTASISINLFEMGGKPNFAPMVSDTTFTLTELSPVGTSVGVIEASDEDNDELVFSILSGNDLAAFELDAASGELLVADSVSLDIDTNPNFTLEIEVSDGALADTATVLVELEEFSDTVNIAPILEDTVFMLVEQSPVGTSVGQIKASDKNEDELFFSILSGNELEAFKLDSLSGELLVADSIPLDYDVISEFSLSIEVSDGELTDSGIVTVELEKVFDSLNVAPFVSGATFTIEEYSPVGTPVGTVAASDENGDRLTFSILTDSVKTVFDLGESSGKLSVLDSTALQFAVNPSFAFEVEASDGQLADTAIIMVDLVELDTNSAPVINSATFTIAEDVVNGTVVGIVTASDDDGDSLTFSISSGNDLLAFGIDENTGQISVVNSEPVSFLNNPSFTLAIKVSDSRKEDVGLITINLTKVEFPPETTDVVLSVDENAAVNTSVGFVEASDQNGDELSYEIVTGNELGAFQLNDSTGEIQVANSEPLDFEINSQFQLEVNVADQSATVSSMVTININDLDDDPLSIGEGSDGPRIYPNPAREVIHIDWQSFSSISIMDLTGRVCIQSQETAIDIYSLRAGAYIMILTSMSGETEKVMLVKE
ncbi:MAG: cadherin domain-containing protein [Cytophagales bacterium]|nr:cadherin domain-containing protein [Cytophagales bacterium]